MGRVKRDENLIPEQIHQNLKLVGECIAAKRHYQKLSIEQLALMAGVSPSFISQIERGIAPHASISSTFTVLYVLGIFPAFGRMVEKKTGDAYAVHSSRQRRVSKKTALEITPMRKDKRGASS